VGQHAVTRGEAIIGGQNLSHSVIIAGTMSQIQEPVAVQPSREDSSDQANIMTERLQEW